MDARMWGKHILRNFAKVEWVGYISIVSVDRDLRAPHKKFGLASSAFS